MPTPATEDIPFHEDENEAIAPDIPRGIDEELLRKYLKSSFMGKPYAGDKTNFDGVVDNLKIVQIAYRKAAKNGKGFTDKHIMQVATLLYQNKFMVHKGQFKDWCTSLFKAMNIEVPAEIRKSVYVLITVRFLHIHMRTNVNNLSILLIYLQLIWVFAL